MTVYWCIPNSPSYFVRIYSEIYGSLAGKTAFVSNFFLIIHERGVPLRILALLLALLCLPFPAFCETPAERLTQLDIFRQHDPRFNNASYRYNGYAFGSGGCGPSSIANALTALMAGPEDDAAPLLLELLIGLTASGHQHDQPIRIGGLPGFLSDPGTASPTLSGLLEGVNSIRVVSPDELLSPILREPAEDGRLLICTAYPLMSRWQQLLTFTHELNRRGWTGARIAFARVSVGTTDTGAPFSSGESGHYVTLFIDPAEFHAEGTLYLIDSLPRALLGETYGSGRTFAARYPFVLYPRSGFSTTYRPERVTDEILRLSLKEDARAAIDGAESYTTWLSLRQQQLKQLGFYGNAILMIYLP